MIRRVHKKGRRAYRLLYYLFDEKRAGHSDAHVVAGWRPPEQIEPPRTPDNRRDVVRLARLLEAPMAGIADAYGKHLVWHCSLSAAPEDPELTDAQWARFIREVLHRTGLEVRGQEDNGVPWVCVRHSPGHVHLVAVLARPDGRRAHLHREYVRLGEAARWAEREFGLRETARPDRTAPKRPARAEIEKAARAGRRQDGRPVAARDILRGHVEAAAAAASSEATFLSGLEAREVKVRLRRSPDRHGRVIGYAVGLPGDRGRGGGQLWFGGGKLAPYLSLPKLRRRWDGGPLTGHRMKQPTAKIVVRREVTAAAAASASEHAFFSELAARGLHVEFRTAPGRPGIRTGYAVGLPGLAGRDGRPVCWAGGTLGAGLTLGQLRARWRTGLRGAAPPGLYDGADAEAVWDHAAGVARAAAAEMQAGRGGPGVALGAADILTVAADVTGSTELRRAADSFGQAARIPGGRRVPRPDPLSAALRTSARLMAVSRPPSRYRPGHATFSGFCVLLLIVAIVVIAAILAVVRVAERRGPQARLALDAGIRLTTAADSWPPAPLADPASSPGRRQRTTRQPSGAPTRRRGTPISPRTGRRL